MIEKLLQDVIAALNANTAALLARPAGAPAAVAASAPAAAPAAPAAAKHTLEQMQARCKELMEKKGKDALVAVFTKMSAKKLSDVKEADYGKLDAEITGALAAENLF
jgi:hypothetical protein